MKYLKVTGLLVLFCLMLSGCSSSKPKSQVKTQPAATYAGWTTVKLGKAGSLQIPDTMEVRNDEYIKKAQEAVKDNSKLVLAMQKQQTMSKNAGTVTCQTKGLNEQGPKALEKGKYAQVIFSAIPVKDKIPGYGQPVGLTAEQIKDFGEITKDGIVVKDQTIDKSTKYSNWQPMKSEIINGAECLYIAYDYQSDSVKPMHVDRYTFFDKNVIYTLEVSSRLAEKDYWHSKDKDISNIVNTLNIVSK